LENIRNKKYKLGVINPSDMMAGVGGGATGFISSILPNLKAEETIIFGIGKNNSLPWEFNKLSKKIMFVPICNLKFPSKIPMRLKSIIYFLRYRKRILNSGVDVLYIHMPECCIPFLYGKKNIPIIYHQHGSGNPVALSRFMYARGYIFRKTFESILKKIYLKADWIIAIDRYCYKKALKNGAKNKTSLIMNAVDTEKFQPNEDLRISSRRKFSIKPNQFAILFVGRIEKTKGVARIIDCISSLKLRKEPFHIFFAGEGSFLSTAMDLVTKKNLSGYVTFLGLVEHEKLPFYYNMADLLILPSDMEGIPMVVLESISCGTPVVASCVGGIPDIVKNKKNGILINDLAPNKLAQAIWEGKDIGSNRKNISKTVKQFSSQEFNRKLNNIILSLIE
jgi:glycosyltransferase involved in cell wall biosynthesis